MSQDRMTNSGDRAVVSGGIGTSTVSPSIGNVLSRTDKALDKVRVVHGANEEYHNLSGRTVGSVRKSLREVFNIPSDADALIDGKKVNDDFILAAGQNLEFSKEAGVKGGV